VTALFGSWVPAWGFLCRTGNEGEVSLIEPVANRLAVEITVLSQNEERATEPFIYESELSKNPEIFRISHRFDNQAKSRAKFSSLAELSAAQLQYKRCLRQADDLREIGRIREAVSELEQIFKLPLAIAPDRRELKKYDEDPQIRRVIVTDWVDQLDWRTFEYEAALLFGRMGYTAWATKRTGDGGVDVRAKKEGENLVIQCKHWKRQRVGVEIIQAIHTIKEKENATRAVLVTSSTLEPVARREAQRCSVEIIEGPRLVDLFAEYCDPDRVKVPVNRGSRESFVPQTRHELVMNHGFDGLGGTGSPRRLRSNQAELARFRFHSQRSNQGQIPGKSLILRQLETLEEQYNNCRCSQCGGDAVLDITNRDGVHIVCKKTSFHRERVDKTTLQRLADHLGIQCRVCGSTTLESKEGATIYLKCRDCMTNSSWEGVSDRLRTEVGARYELSVG
jgi:HJR/Mrr/RecB family endonuclease